MITNPNHVHFTTTNQQSFVRLAPAIKSIKN